jgi:hypothetical protein
LVVDLESDDEHPCVTPPVIANRRCGDTARPSAVLDGTLIPIDRVADQKPYHYSSLHRATR